MPRVSKIWPNGGRSSWIRETRPILMISPSSLSEINATWPTRGRFRRRRREVGVKILDGDRWSISNVRPRMPWTSKVPSRWSPSRPLLRKRKTSSSQKPSDLSPHNPRLTKKRMLDVVEKKMRMENKIDKWNNKREVSGWY